MLSVQLPPLLIWFTGIDEYHINQDRGRRTVKKGINSIIFQPEIWKEVSPGCRNSDAIRHTYE